MTSYAPRSQRSAWGFSLIEIAVVLLIISILVTIVAVPLSSQIEQQRTLDTQRQLEAIKEAVYGFAMANGRLPCPATSASNGTELFDTALSGTATNGICATFSGFVPAVTLGLAPVDSSGFYVDGWGISQNRMRYAVSRVTVAAATTGCTTTGTNLTLLTKTDGIKTETMGCLSTTAHIASFLTVKSTTVTNAAAGCTPATLTSTAPFVLFSLGKNAVTGGTGADEAENLVTNSSTFVFHPPTSAANCAGEFDDIVTWGSLNTLFARMVQAGKLP